MPSGLRHSRISADASSWTPRPPCVISRPWSPTATIKPSKSATNCRPHRFRTARLLNGDWTCLNTRTCARHGFDVRAPQAVHPGRTRHTDFSGRGPGFAHLAPRDPFRPHPPVRACPCHCRNRDQCAGPDAHILGVTRMNEPDHSRQARLRRRFDRAAARYDEFAGVQREITLRLLERLDLVQLDPGCVVDLGAGTGDGTAQLCQRYPPGPDCCGRLLACHAAAESKARAGQPFRRGRRVSSAFRARHGRLGVFKLHLAVVCAAGRGLAGKSPACCAPAGC